MASARVLASLALVLALAGCSGGQSAAAPSSTPAASPPRSMYSPNVVASTSAHPDPVGLTACTELPAALDRPDGAQKLSVLFGIGTTASGSTNPSVRMAGQFLADSARIATQAVGKSDEGKTRDAAVKAGRDLLDACRRAKLTS